MIPETIRQKILRDYQGLVGKVVRVSGLTGGVENDTVDFASPDRLAEVRILETKEADLCQTCDGHWYTPLYECEIVSLGDLAPVYSDSWDGPMPRSCWVFGTSYSVDGRTDAGEIV